MKDIFKVTNFDGSYTYRNAEGVNFRPEWVEQPGNRSQYNIITESQAKSKRLEVKRPNRPGAKPPAVQRKTAVQPQAPVAPAKPPAQLNRPGARPKSQAEIATQREIELRKQSEAVARGPQAPVRTKSTKPSVQLVTPKKQASSLLGSPADELSLPRASGKNLGTNEVDKQIQEALRSRNSRGFPNEKSWAEEQLAKPAGTKVDKFGNTYSRLPKDVDMGIPHTESGERLWRKSFEASGRPTEQLRDKAIRNFPGPKQKYDWRYSTTDLGVDVDGNELNVDIQNTYDFRNEGTKRTMNVGIFKGIDPEVNHYKMWQEAPASQNVQSILQDMQSADPGMIRSKFGMTDSGLWLPIKSRTDQYMKTHPDYFRQDVLVGGLYDSSQPLNQMEGIARGKRNVRGGQKYSTKDIQNLRNKGAYDPKLPKSVYGVDLEAARNNVLGLSKRELQNLQSDPRYSAITSFEGDVNLGLSIDGMKEIGESDKVLNSLLSSEVKEGLNRASRNSGGGDLFRAQFLPGADEAIQGLKRNWKGGLTNTVLNGATREVGKKVAQGDWKGAITEFGMTYGAGAAIESGLKGAANSGVVKQVASAVGRRLPGVGARFAGGTAGSGGLLGPVMGGIAAVEIADGVVEGVTGKGTLDHAADNVRDTYTRTTGDKRSDEQIATAMTPQGVYKPEQVGGPKLTQDKISDISAGLERSTGVGTAPVDVPQVGVSTPQVKAQDNLMGWIKKINPWK